MTTVTKTDLIDYEGDIDGGMNYNVPPDNGRCETRRSIRPEQPRKNKSSGRAGCL